MLLHPANLLILDEPTNHLDLTSKDVLLEALKAFQGTVIFVSHDRGFIEDLADRVLELEAGKPPRWYVGNYRYFLEKKAALDREEALGLSGGQGSRVPGSEGAGKGSASGPGEKGAAGKGQGRGLEPGTASPPGQARAQARQLSYEEDKARKARLRKLQKREEEILARLEAIGPQKSACEHEMGLSANYTDPSKMRRLQADIEALEAESERLNAEWEAVAQELAEAGSD
jgi:ATP-binding cassette subfamily F protein 3